MLTNYEVVVGNGQSFMVSKVADLSVKKGVIHFFGEEGELLAMVQLSVVFYIRALVNLHVVN